MLLSQDYHKTTTASVLEQRVDQFTAIMRSWLAARPEQPISHLVYRGVSGACMAWPLSYRLRIPVVAIRKPGERSHGYDSLERGVISGDGDLQKYVIVDDFIASGTTIKEIIKRLDDEWQTGNRDYEKPSCEAIILHDIHEWGRQDEFFELSEDGAPREIPIISCKTAI